MLCLILLPETLPNYSINYRWNDNFVKTSYIKFDITAHAVYNSTAAFGLAQVYSLGQPEIRKSAKGTGSIASCWNC